MNDHANLVENNNKISNNESMNNEFHPFDEWTWVDLVFILKIDEMFRARKSEM